MSNGPPLPPAFRRMLRPPAGGEARLAAALAAARAPASRRPRPPTSALALGVTALALVAIAAPPALSVLQRNEANTALRRELVMAVAEAGRPGPAVHVERMTAERVAVVGDVRVYRLEPLPP